MKWFPYSAAMAACTMLLPTVHASDPEISSPQAGGRTYAQNFKDMVLATCIAQAYRNDSGAATDAGSSVSALRDWTYFDLEKSPDAIKSVVNSYLERNYANPLVESEISGVKFDYLKCMDLYHSKTLEDVVQRLVIHPKRTYRQDNPIQRANGSASSQ